MPTTADPKGLVWINNVNPATFGSLNTNVCWFLGSSALTITACWLMTRVDAYEPVGVFVDGLKSAQGQPLRQMVLVSHESMRQLGYALSTALLFAWTGKTAAGVVDAKFKREAHPDYAPVLEAKERGKVAGAAAEVVIAERAADMKATREHQVQALQVPAAPPAEPQQQVNVITGDNAQVPPVQPLMSTPLDRGGQTQAWATGDEEGVL